MINITGVQHSADNEYTAKLPAGILLRIERRHNDYPAIIIKDTIHIPFEVLEQVEDLYKEWCEL